MARFLYQYPDNLTSLITNSTQSSSHAYRFPERGDRIRDDWLIKFAATGDALAYRDFASTWLCAWRIKRSAARSRARGSSIHSVMHRIQERDIRILFDLLEHRVLTTGTVGGAPLRLLRNTITYTPRQMHEGGPKTAAGRRTVLMPLASF